MRISAINSDPRRDDNGSRRDDGTRSHHGDSSRRRHTTCAIDSSRAYDGGGVLRPHSHRRGAGQESKTDRGKISQISLFLFPALISDACAIIA